ncbi:hypothetical protein CQW23_23834 [Capsicum baccatum]|uniref:Ubiquitin-like protease family profile domain-containing protein n=1 Tax=Capsicum baccatum TaxID=33114 RepID=A0A2G2VT27_CAPBA|nr:hypothetical protein CQW23_23834 [Capsicum baccatum]
MLPTYLSDSGFFEKTKRTDWTTLNTYKYKLGQCIQFFNKKPFDVHYLQNIPHQASASMDCGIFVAAYAEILSEGLEVHSCGFDAQTQCAHYASLLWNYGVTKAMKGYASDNGDPPSSRNFYLQSIDENAIVTLE